MPVVEDAEDPVEGLDIPHPLGRQLMGQGAGPLGAAGGGQSTHAHHGHGQQPPGVVQQADVVGREPVGPLPGQVEGADRGSTRRQGDDDGAAVAELGHPLEVGQMGAGDIGVVQVAARLDHGLQGGALDLDHLARPGESPTAEAPDLQTPLVGDHPDAGPGHRDEPVEVLGSQLGQAVLVVHTGEGGGQMGQRLHPLGERARVVDGWGRGWVVRQAHPPPVGTAAVMLTGDRRRGVGS